MKLRLVVVLAVIAGAIAFLAVKGLGDATVFFKNADEAALERDELGVKRFRLQGTVVPDSVETIGTGVEFDVEFRCESVHVRHEGDPPELFKPGIPVVLEGRYAAPPSEVYESDKIIVNHTNEYRVDDEDREALAEEARRECR